MSEDRSEALCDAVLTAFEHGAAVDYGEAGGDPMARAELAALERTALLTSAAFATSRSREPMPATLFRRMVVVGQAIAATPGLAASQQAAPTAAALARRAGGRSWRPFLLGAAAGLAAAWLAWLAPLADQQPPTPRIRREAFVQTAAHSNLPWQAGPSGLHGTVQGDVVWCAQRQEGYLRIQGLQPLPPEQQYQLWIVDARREGPPIDGGLFDLSDAAEQIVPIQARLRVAEAKAFVVTVEPRGGVVVSDQKDVVAIASL